MTRGFNEAQINNIGRSGDSEKHGISYVETGEGAYVTLYTGNNYMGSSLTIDPDSQVWLEEIRINSESKSWNDHVDSIYFQGHEGAHVNQFSSVVFPDKIPTVADHCALLFGSDPYKPQPHGTTGVILCGDPLKAKVWKFSYDDIADMGYPLRQYSLGVSYILIGGKADLIMYSGENFDGNEYKFKPSAKKVDLSTLPYPEKDQLGWNNKPLSFTLILNE